MFQAAFSAPSAFSAFGFAARLGRGGGSFAGFLPSVCIYVTATTEKSCR